MSIAAFKKSLGHMWTAHKTEVLSVIGILILALWLRAVRLPNEIIWNGDTARDLLVARHLNLYDESLEIGHSAYGLRIDTPKNDGDPYGMSHYPSYYFRMMAVLWNVTGSVYAFMGVLMFLQVVSLAVLYYGLRQLFGHVPALFGIAAVVLSVKAIEHSLGAAIHPSLVVLFFIFTAWTTGWKKNNSWLMGSATLLCILGTLIHYTFLILFGWLVVLTIVALYTKDAPYKAMKYLVLALATGITTFFLLHLEIIRFYGFREFLGTFLGQYQQQTFSLSRVYAQFMDILLFRLRGIFPLWTSICMAVTLGIMSYVGSSEKKLVHPMAIMAGFALSLLMLGALKPFDEFHYEQVVFVDYVLLVLAGVSLGKLLSVRQIEVRLGVTTITLFLLASVTLLAYTKPPIFLTKPITAAREHAQALLEKNPYPIEKTEFYVSSYYSPNYETPTVLFWLEELSGKRLVKLVNVYNNIGWFDEEKTHMIASCQRFPTMPGNEAASCQTWLGEFESSGKYVLEKELFSTDNYRAFLYRKK